MAQGVPRVARARAGRRCYTTDSFGWLTMEASRWGACNDADRHFIFASKGCPGNAARGDLSSKEHLEHGCSAALVDTSYSRARARAYESPANAHTTKSRPRYQPYETAIFPKSGSVVISPCIVSRIIAMP